MTQAEGSETKIESLNAVNVWWNMWRRYELHRIEIAFLDRGLAGDGESDAFVSIHLLLIESCDFPINKVHSKADTALFSLSCCLIA